MRRYPVNSPQAIARVIALTVLADGAVSRGELSSLVRYEMHQCLGVDEQAIHTVLDDFAWDLYEFGVPVWDHSGGFHPLVVQCVLDDVTDPEMRAQLYQICRNVAEADSHLSNGEQAVLQITSAQWRLAAPTEISRKGLS
jgi:uncharacterized tellurite resistance protein B-like protein